jgi:DNA-binding GntR family transcriptional regulator
MGGHHADHCIVKIDIVGQVLVSSATRFSRYSVAYSRTAYRASRCVPRSGFLPSRRRRRGFHQHHGIVQRLAQGDAVGVQHAAADPP